MSSDKTSNDNDPMHKESRSLNQDLQHTDGRQTICVNVEQQVDQCEAIRWGIWRKQHMSAERP